MLAEITFLICPQFLAFMGQYPPQDDIEMAMYTNAQNIIGQNVEWAEFNQQMLLDWLIRAVARTKTSQF